MTTKLCLVLFTMVLSLFIAPQAIFAQPPPLSAQITIMICDGDGHPMANQHVEVTIENNKTGEHTRSLYQGQPLQIGLPDQGEHKHSYTISAHAPGYQATSNKHVHIQPGTSPTVYLMLVPHHAGLDMDQAHWENLAAEDPQLLSMLLCNGQGPQDCSGAYEKLLKLHPQNLAALINISVALQQIQIGGRSAFSYYQAIGLDQGLLRDRFFAYVDKSLLLQLKANTADKHRHTPPGDTPFTSLHLSWILQLTFNEKNTLLFNGIECVRVDTDIDYYRRFNHGLREVIPNLLLHRRSSPLRVFQLRWRATKKQQLSGSPMPDFAPMIGLKPKDNCKPNH